MQWIDHLRSNLLLFRNLRNQPNWTQDTLLQNLELKSILSKGQLISKCLFRVFNFFRKTNENKSTWGIIVVKSNSFVRFLEETSAWKKSFRLCLPFSSSPIKIRRANPLLWCSVFACLFLNLQQLPAAKMDMQKPSITTNIWSFLFCQSFNIDIVMSNTSC